jgi:hypothetical protein
MKKQASKIYNNLQKRRKAIKIRAYLMSGFLLAINSFAWFVFISNGNTDISANVISWNIAFLDENEQYEMVDIDLTDLYPGMRDFSRTIVIKNRSDLNAQFSYEIQSITIYGQTFTSPDYIMALENEFPFSITFNHDTEAILMNEKVNFTVSVTWPFESINSYYRLNSLYPYSATYNYYVYNGNSYIKTIVTESNYTEMLNNGLYVESDDADTYWGEKSVTFKETHPDESAISLKVKLIVSQDVIE